ncbi:hypothetical protein LX95_01722 [Mesonia algae]|uniref:Uncharacterized protein n=1 Tax=Mesonia algae TaxID=213248 RepID=A0A2W7I1N2_9FLAO|nr:hypothetical protein [Mesonia algae]PZW40654.1 hypothetical protein LX95_01722 [Mesonia algae]
MPIKRKKIFVIVAGILIMAISQILAQYFNFSDIVKGLINGLGIGVLFTAFLIKEKQSA